MPLFIGNPTKRRGSDSLSLSLSPGTEPPLKVSSFSLIHSNRLAQETLMVDALGIAVLLDVGPVLAEQQARAALAVLKFLNEILTSENSNSKLLKGAEVKRTVKLFSLHYPTAQGDLLSVVHFL